MPSGILIIDKSPGWTSQDAAAKLRGLYGERRVGHGGTLDPMATGVLPVFLGRATRAVEFFEHAEQEYVAGVRLGLTTDTEDTSGAVLSEQPVHAAEAQVRAAVEALAGEREQVPPMYSAVKIGGRKLYELARAGKEIERKARRITVIESELLDGGGAHWRFRVLCSKGTYVRTLCRELGETLGCGGCMESLRRTRAGCFGLDGAHTIEEIIGHHYDLDDFQIQAVTEGREAMGEAIVKLRCEGRVYSGRGLSTDIIGSAISAYINAMNKIVYEEETE